MNNQAGLTLIELLVVIAILAIISSVAYPSYQSYLFKVQRGEAKVALIKAQLQQSSIHILNPNYSDDVNTLGLIDNVDYIFSVVSASSSTYLLQAVAQGSQTGDTGCTTLTIDQDSQKTPLSCW